MVTENGRGRGHRYVATVMGRRMGIREGKRAFAFAQEAWIERIWLFVAYDWWGTW